MGNLLNNCGLPTSEDLILDWICENCWVQQSFSDEDWKGVVKTGPNIRKNFIVHFSPDSPLPRVSFEPHIIPGFTLGFFAHCPSCTNGDFIWENIYGCLAMMEVDFNKKQKGFPKWVCGKIYDNDPKRLVYKKDYEYIK